MTDFENRVALITGAANGFGKEFVKECAARKMRIAAVDIEGDEAEAVCAEARKLGAEAFAIKADVTCFEDVEKAVASVMDRYGQIDLLFNNAGVAFFGSVTSLPVRDWEWIVHANVLSHVYFMKLVIPIMLSQGTHCNIVNVASVAGLITTPQLTAYHMTKHAAVALSESVEYEMQAIGADIHLSVFCPGFVQTDLHHCERHRPERYKDESDPYYSSETYYKCLKQAEHEIVNGIPIDSIAMRVFNDIEEDRFYILTHPQYELLIGKRAQDILSGANPDVKIFMR